MKLLALDISSTAVGVAIFHEGELVQLQTHRLAGDLYSRIRKAGELMYALATGSAAEALAIEAPAYHAHAKALIAQQRVVGAMLAAWLTWNGGPIVEIAPASAKLALTGSGKAGKEQMITQARYKVDGRFEVTEHAADAYSVGRAALGILTQLEYTS